MSDKKTLFIKTLKRHYQGDVIKNYGGQIRVSINLENPPTEYSIKININDEEINHEKVVTLKKTLTGYGETNTYHTYSFLVGSDDAYQVILTPEVMISDWVENENVMALPS